MMNSEEIIKIRKGIRYNLEEILKVAYAIAFHQQKQGPAYAIQFLQRVLNVDKEKAGKLWRAFREELIRETQPKQE